MPYTRWNTPNRKFYNYKWLYQKYWIEGLSLQEIGKLLNVNGNNAILRQMKIHNVPRRKSGGLCGEKNYRWKGIRLSKATGYNVININGKTYYHHRYLVEQHLKRKLSPKEIVHHINGIKTDNRLKNLYLFSSVKLHNQYTQKLISEILKQIHKPYITFKNSSIKPITKSNLL